MLTVYSWPVPFISGFILIQLFRHINRRFRYASIARQFARDKRLARDTRRQELLELLQRKYSSKLPERSVSEKIFKSTAVELLDGLSKKEFTYTQVVLVLSLRTIQIGKEINCTTEEFFDEAIKYAEQFDNDDSDNHDELLLKGIPISIKEHIDQKGAVSSMGMAMRNFRPAVKDSLIIELLKAQGAIPGFVRTATIQGMMLPDTESETYGVASNPFDRMRTPGGSSGGEGALIASRGSPIGIGTDIGGSIRIPAHFCGIFGFKPTPGRLTAIGVVSNTLRNHSGETNIRGTVGPLARCTDDLILVMRSLLNEKIWLNDPELPRQPWREERFNDKKRLTIGYYTNDTWFPPAPACIRAVNETVEVLRKLGHKVVPYTPINVPEAVRLFVSIIGADGVRHFIEALENEPVNPLYHPLLQSARLPNFLRPLVGRILTFLGERRNAHIVRSVGSKSAYDYLELVIDLKFYKRLWLDDLKKNHIDLLLTPANGLPAYRHGQSGHLFHSCSYSFLFNILHLPAGIVPVTLVRDDEQYYEAIGDLYNDRATSMAKDVCRQSAGLPIGIQLVGWPNDDERVLMVMKELESEKEIFHSRIPDWINNIDIYTKN